MKKTIKQFQLEAGNHLGTNGPALVTISGRDIYDAYRKAKEQYAWVRMPYPSRKHKKSAKREYNRLIRRNGVDKAPAHDYFWTDNGVVRVD